MTKEYEIKTVNDLLQFNDRQLDACLADMKLLVKYVRGINERISICKAAMPDIDFEGGIVLQDFMLWVDDGINEGEITVVNENNDVLRKITIR